jgi:hypothetical protein
MFYRWWNRYQAQGWSGLEERRRGRPSGPEPDDFLKEKVIKLRTRYEWGPKKIAGSLQLKGFNIDNNQAYKIICQAGLNHPITQPRRTWGTKRFPNVLNPPNRLPKPIPNCIANRNQLLSNPDCADSYSSYRVVDCRVWFSVQERLHNNRNS